MVEVNSTARRGADLRLPFGFAELINPVGLAEFKAEYWERKHLLLHRETPDYYGGLLTLTDMDELLSTTRVSASDMRVIADGKETPVSDLVSENLPGSYANAVEMLYSHYRKGATINLLFLQEHWTPLTRLCQSMSDVLGGMFHVNVYLTPAGARGLKEHYDTHDVFVAQVYGSKRWRLYEPPVQLPLKDQRYLPPEDGPGEPMADLTLHPGDMLYMPRGTVHQAVSQETASLHLTVGVQSVLWADLLRNAVEQATADDVRFRSALPMGFAGDEELARKAEKRAAELLDLLRDSIKPEAVVATGRTRAMLARRSTLHGHLLDLESLSSLDLDTKLQRRPETVWHIAENENDVGLVFHGKELHFPKAVEPALRSTTGVGVFSPREISGGLDEASRLVLARKLLEEGFLTRADRTA
jgi:ribosomal protein L16 Arg81 hydroxylase